MLRAPLRLANSPLIVVNGVTGAAGETLPDP
jgi:hypothetical protein